MTLQACAEIVEKGDPDRFLAAMAAPPAARQILFPIYAFNVEVARAPWVTEEPMIAEMRLQWWRDVLEEIGNGSGVRQHEVTTELAAVLPKNMVPVLDGLVQARRWDIYKDPFENPDHFAEYLSATGGGLMRACAVALNNDDDPAYDVLGRVHGLANWFRAVPALSSAGRHPFPDPSASAIQQLAQDALGELRTSRATIAKPARPATRAAWLAAPILRSVAKDPDVVFSGTLDVSEFRRRGSLLLRSVLGQA